MTRTNTVALVATLAVAAVVAIVVILVAGGGNDTQRPTPPTTAGGRPATLGVTKNADLGRILDDSKGRTLYLFARDAGGKSACSGACAAAWPPLRASRRPIVGSGADASAIATTPRADGAPQVTYHGHPLYTYTGDGTPGDTKGQGLSAFGGGWFAVSPAGNQVAGQGSGSGPGY